MGMYNLKFGKFKLDLDSLSIFMTVQIVLSFIFIILANLITYPLNIDNDLLPITYIACVTFVIRIVYTIFIGWQWGKYYFDDLVHSFFRPLFYYCVFICCFVLLMQLFFPSTTGILLWPVISFLFIEIDAGIVLIFGVTVLIPPSSTSDAYILLYLMIFFLGAIIFPIILVLFFFLGYIFRKTTLKLNNLMHCQNLDYFNELKYFLFSLAIIGTFILSIFDFSNSTVFNQPAGESGYLMFALFEIMGLTFLIAVYYLKKREYLKKKTSKLPNDRKLNFN